MPDSRRGRVVPGRTVTSSLPRPRLCNKGNEIPTKGSYSRRRFMGLAGTCTTAATHYFAYNKQYWDDSSSGQLPVFEKGVRFEYI